MIITAKVYDHGEGKSKALIKALKKRGVKVKKIKLKRLKAKDLLGLPMPE